LTVDAFDVSKRHAEKIAIAVRRCIAACADAQKGFALASGGAHDPDLRVFFEACSKERGEFVGELGGVLASLGEDVDGGGTALGLLHRAAVDVRLAFEGASDRVLLEECDRGESAAQHQYEIARSELVRLGAPKGIRETIDAQYAAVCDARYQIGGKLTRMMPPSTSGPPRST